MNFTQQWKWKWPIVSILITSLIIFAVACNKNAPPCDDGQTRNDNGACVKEMAVPPKSVEPPSGVPASEEVDIFKQRLEQREYTWEPKRFSWGQYSLIRRQDDPFMRDGIAFFNEKNFEAAQKKFSKSAENDSGAPEAIIYKNNSIARLQKSAPYSIAVPIPVDDNIGNAEEILRGVAQAQEKFNSSPKSDLSRLLEVVIVDDGLLNATDEEKKSVVEQVSAQLSNDASILGIVGHNSSGSTQIALQQYEQASLAVVSPTSTSTNLRESDVFFRVSPSDEVAARKLACYVKKKVGENAGGVIFYDSSSSYSKSFMAQFYFFFAGGKTEAVLEKDMISPEFEAVREVLNSAYKEGDRFALLIPSTKSHPVAIDVARENAALDSSHKLQIVGGDSLYGKTKLDSGAQSLNGLVLPVAWFSDVKSSQRFYEEGLKQWGGREVNWRTAMSHDATAALLKVFSENSTSREDIISSLKSVTLSPEKTSGTEFRFTLNRERSLAPVLIRVETNETVASKAESKYRLIDEELEGKFCLGD